MNKKALIAASIVTLAAIIVLGWTGVLHANDENIASSISEVWGENSQWGSINTGSSQQNVSGKTLTSSSKAISPLPGEESRNLAISSGLVDSTSSKTHMSSSASSKAESASTPYSSAVSSNPSPPPPAKPLQDLYQGHLFRFLPIQSPPILALWQVVLDLLPNLEEIPPLLSKKSWNSQIKNVFKKGWNLFLSAKQQKPPQLCEPRKFFPLFPTLAPMEAISLRH